VDPSLIGLALSYALPLTGVISAFMRDFLSTELGFISVERIDEYSKLESKICERSFSVFQHTVALGKAEGD